MLMYIYKAPKKDKKDEDEDDVAFKKKKQEEAAALKAAKEKGAQHYRLLRSVIYLQIDLFQLSKVRDHGSFFVTVLTDICRRSTWWRY